MAATDQHYRNQRWLDIVFAVSCILMLISVIWMFAQDFYRPFKKEVREFRNVEEAMFQRSTLALVPDEETRQQIAAAEQKVKDAREGLKKAQADPETQRKVSEFTSNKRIAEARYQALKADFDSLVSKYNIAVERRNAERSDSAAYKSLNEDVVAMKGQIESQNQELLKVQNEIDAEKKKLDTALIPIREAEGKVSQAEDELKKLTADFERFCKLTAQKRWGFADWFRSLPVLDAFNSPIRIQQYTLEDYPINYNFKYVTRYDRCTTCHLGIDRPSYTKEDLRRLKGAPTDDQKNKLIVARQLLQQRQERLGPVADLSPGDLGDLSPLDLSDAKISEYCAHPRLDLFVGANSPHPAEKFGCTSCHAGQGSATEFNLASHTPNDAKIRDRWVKEHGWESNHYWDFPMLPKRFLESTCLKCHHQVTDLVRDGSLVEAPKLIRGYNLVRENGCFGCHEINGMKGGRSVGPDMRLEPHPPVEAFTPAERARDFGDPLNPPGALRKVGPSLARLSEKTNPQWVLQWLSSPRSFRPDTKMPHFYNLSNNSPDLLEKQQTGQQKFPNAEMHAITHYLFHTSGEYLKGSDQYRRLAQAKLDGLKQKELRSETENREMESLERLLEIAKPPVPLDKLIPELPAEAKDDKEKQEQLKRGRQLFSERGCLACHIHHGTTENGLGLPSISSDAHFGPNLTRVALKLGTKPGDTASARRWLIQWITNPNIHNPRTYMPVTHLTAEQANDIAAWLLGQKEEWQGPDVPAPDTETLQLMARVYLDKIYPITRAKEIVDKGLDPQTENLAPEADERLLAGPIDDDKLKLYVGKKAINNLGCFGCHQIPGFETAKPIGTPLNDWGRKDAERLAFEDAAAFVRNKHYFIEGLTDKDGKPYGINKDGRTPYEKTFYESLHHHQREGFLYQKLREPRSYDFDRIKTWDERLRMPQFKFARTEKKADETDEEYQARSDMEEAEAREAVMTFVLGLVAEPVPPKYVYNPGPDRRAEIKGRQVLDKFNCGGCHQIRPGVFEIQPTVQDVDGDNVLAKLREAFRINEKGGGQNVTVDLRFPDHSSWRGKGLTADGLLKVHGFVADLNETTAADLQERKEMAIRLAEAVRFPDTSEGKDQKLDIRANSEIYVPRQAVAQQSTAYGGAFADLLVSYLIRLNPTNYPKDNKSPPDSLYARIASPPSLLREGERTQQDWLFRFLQQPFEIRPAAVLRMPRFNLSEDDATALVNYFAAVDRLGNPATGLNYPYFPLPQVEGDFLPTKSAEYVQRLKQANQYQNRVQELTPIWSLMLTDQITETKRLRDIEAKKAESEKEPVKKQEAERLRDALEKQLKELEEREAKKDYKAYEEEWASRQAYATDAYRSLVNNACRQCHQIGSVRPGKGRNEQGPPLNLSAGRLRPDWTRRLLAAPNRMVLNIMMPQNFPPDKAPDPALFVPDPNKKNVTAQVQEQIDAVRDILMILPQVQDMPVNKFYRP